MVLDRRSPAGVRHETAAVSWVGSSRAKYDPLRSRKTEIDLSRREELEPAEEREPMHLLRAADPRERLVELDPHAVRRPVAGVRDDEEEEAAVEDDVEDHLGVAALVSHWPSYARG